MMVMPKAAQGSRPCGHESGKRRQWTCQTAFEPDM